VTDKLGGQSPILGTLSHEGRVGFVPFPESMHNRTMIRYVGFQLTIMDSIEAILHLRLLNP
jgi:hypothetical protein